MEPGGGLGGARREPGGGGIHRICQRLRLVRMCTHTAEVTIILDDVQDAVYNVFALDCHHHHLRSAFQSSISSRRASFLGKDARFLWKPMGA
jgi:hypothetical protein